jgi:hypothetical protein
MNRNGTPTTKSRKSKTTNRSRSSRVYGGLSKRVYLLDRNYEIIDLNLPNRNYEIIDLNRNAYACKILGRSFITSVKSLGRPFITGVSTKVSYFNFSIFPIFFNSSIFCIVITFI